MLSPNTLLEGRYLIIQPIGQGGMGEVYLAIDQRLGSSVAVKRTFFTENVALKQAFEREARILARLRHTALPKVTDTFTAETHQYIVMEYIGGNDLGKMLFLQNRPFPVSNVLTWTDSLLDALEYLHSHEPPIIHRDIKPQNLKLTESNQIILLDFGLAKNSVAQTGDTSNPASVVGYTLTYAPLEQIRGTGTVPRSDLYALSATVYHLLTNISPPDALLRASSLVDGTPDPVIPLHQLNPEVSPEVSQVIMRGMTLSADKRIPTAKDMRVILREAMREKRHSIQAQTEVLEGNAPEVKKYTSNQFETEKFSSNQFETERLPANFVSNPPLNFQSNTNPPPLVSNPNPPNYVSTPQNFTSNPNPSAQKTDVLPNFAETLRDVNDDSQKTVQMPPVEIPNHNPPVSPWQNNIQTFVPPTHNTNPNAGRTEQFPVNQNSQPFPVDPNSPPFPVNQNSQPSPNYLVAPTNASPTFAENVQVPLTPVNNQFQVNVPSFVSTPIMPENLVREDKPKSRKGLAIAAIGGGGALGAIVLASAAGVYFLNPFGAATNSNSGKTNNLPISASSSPTPAVSPSPVVSPTKTPEVADENKNNNAKPVAEKTPTIAVDKPRPQPQPEKPQPQPEKPVVTKPPVIKPPVIKPPVTKPPATKTVKKTPNITFEQ